MTVVRGRVLLVLAGAILIVAATAAVTAISLRITSATAQQGAATHLEAVASLKKELLEAWLAERAKDARGVSSSPALVEPERDRLSAEGMAWLESIAAPHVYSSAEVRTLDGRTVWKPSRAPAAEETKGLLALIAEAGKSGETEFELIPDRNGKLSLSFSHRLRDRDLVLLLAVDAATALNRILGPWPGAGETAETVLARRDGNDVLLLTDLRGEPGAAGHRRFPLDSSLPIAMAVRGREGIFEGSDYRGERVIVMPKRIAGTQWVLITKIDRDEVLAPSHAHAARAAATTLLLLLVAGMFSLLLARRHEAEVLRQSQSRFRLLFERSPIGTAVLREGRISSVNPAFAETFGCPRADLVGRDAVSLFDLDEGTSGELLTRRAEGTETVGFRCDGSRFPAELTTGEVAMPDGTAVIAFVRDISEREEQKKSLVRSRDFLLRLFDRIPSPVWRADATADLTYFNAAWLEFRGRTLEEEAGDGWTQGIHEQDLRRVMLTWRGAFERRVPYELDYRLLHRSGEHRWVREFATPFTDPDGSFGGFIGTCYDIHEGRLAEAKLRGSEARFRSMIEGSKDLMVILDERGIIAYVNPVIQEFLGYDAKELLGKSGLELVHPDDQPAGQAAAARGGVQGRRPAGMRLRHHDGSWRYFEATANRLDDQGRELLISLRDLTEHRELEAAFDRSRRLNSLGLLSATIAHEFNNILMGIQPFAHVVERMQGAKPEVREALRHIRNSVRRGRDVTQRILRFVQPADPELKPLEIRGWLATSSDALGGLIPSVVDLEIEPGNEELWVLADEGQMDQVLSNLMLNAVQAMPKGGTLRISASSVQDPSVGRETHSLARFIVEDSGEGIPPEVLLHIFEPLFTTRKGGGTGLGLSLAHQIIQNHGGEIIVSSVVGSGTRFLVDLPRTESRVVSSPPAEDLSRAAEARSAVRNLKLLLVEDDEAVAEGVLMLLGIEGIQTAHAKDGTSALEAIAAAPPDAVILDIGLPDRDGISVFEEISKRWPGLPVIFSTGQGDQGRLYRYLALPNVAYLLKPYDIDVLVETIARVVGTPAR